MIKEDFKFKHKDTEHDDYYFDVVGDTEQEMTHDYGEMCMIGISDVIYSRSDGRVYIKRLFPFNCDVIRSDSSELKEMLQGIVAELQIH